MHSADYAVARCLSVRLFVFLLRPVYSDATQLDVELSCVGEVSIATRRLNSTRRRVELRRYKRALTEKQTDGLRDIATA